MTEDNKTRVVLLLSGRFDLAEKLQANLGDNASLRYTENQYTCAADLLSDSPKVLAVDLRYITQSHLGLLDIARKQNCEMLIFGSPAVGISQADLNSAKITTPENICEDVKKILNIPDEKPVIETRHTKPAETQKIQPPKEMKSMGHWIIEAGKKAEKTPAPAPKTQPAPTVPPVTPEVPADLLSADELAALLEDTL